MWLTKVDLWRHWAVYIKSLSDSLILFEAVCEVKGAKLDDELFLRANLETVHSQITVYDVPLMQFHKGFCNLRYKVLHLWLR